MKAWLETKDGNRVQLHRACLIGRSTKCDVVLADTHISRRHTLIQQQDEHEFWLVDLGSSNGTKLNGRRLSQPCRLKDGDAFRLHNFEFSFQTANPCNPTRSTNSLGLHAQATKRIGADIESVRCWLLLADIDNSTRLSQTVPPDEWARTVGSWLLHCRDEIESVGGTVNKYLGDGLFAYLRDSVDAADRIRTLITKLGALQASRKPPFHVVVHHGVVTIGGVSAGDEESFLGPEVNFAFRLEKVASQMRVPIAMSASARGLWPTSTEICSLGTLTVAGFDGSHEVFGIKK